MNATETMKDRCERCDCERLESVMRTADVVDARYQALHAEVEQLRAELAEARVAAEQGVLVARDLEEKLRREREAGLSLRASLVEAVVFARATVGDCSCHECAPTRRLAERWERQARGTP